LDVVDAQIHDRVTTWLRDGLLDEVDALALRGLSATAAQAVGYKELLAFRRGECTMEEAVALIEQHTRQLVRRQRSWFRRDPRIQWFSDIDEARVALAQHFVNHVGD
jgi:tRNA dimethylallyltransferase